MVSSIEKSIIRLKKKERCGPFSLETPTSNDLSLDLRREEKLKAPPAGYRRLKRITSLPNRKKRERGSVGSRLLSKSESLDGVEQGLFITVYTKFRNRLHFMYL